MPNVVLGGSTKIANPRISLPSALSASLTSILIEKKCDDSEIEPTVRASLTCKHIASFLSFVVSQPSVPPAPSDSATQRFTLLRSKALSRCCDSNL